MTLYIDHHVVILFSFVDMRRHKRYEASLLCIQFNRVEYPPAYNPGIKRSVNIVRNAHLIGSADHRIRIFTCDQYDRNIIDPMIPVHMGQHFKTIHNRHHYIQKNKRNTCALLLQDFQTFTAVYRLKNPILPAKHRRQNLPIDFGIIHDQYLLFPLRLFFFDDINQISFKFIVAHVGKPPLYKMD